MSTLYRLVPYVTTAKKNEQGHPLYFPSNRGVARVDNNLHYQVAYVAKSGDCAVAETFGFLNNWDSQMLRPIKNLPGSTWSIISYTTIGVGPIFDMDAASNLVKFKLRPSCVVTRDRATSQAWALKVFSLGSSAGVSWWSFYSPDWVCVGLWDFSKLKVSKIEAVTLDHPAVNAASRIINRTIIN